MLDRARFCRLTLGTAAAAPFVLATQRASAASDTILVVVFLFGGCDFLNTVIPISTRQYGAYRTLRTAPAGRDAAQQLTIDTATIAAAGTAFDTNPATAASSATEYAFHPGMKALRSVYAGGHLAVVAGVGIPPDDPLRLGHDSAQFDWQTGTLIATGRAPIGWAGRLADRAPSRGAIPPAVALDGTSPIALTGATTVPLGIASPLENFSLNEGASSDADGAKRDAALVASIGAPALEPAGALARGVASDTRTLVDVVGKLAATTRVPDYPVTATSSSYLNLQLMQAARLIVGGASSRVYFASQGGYDTHDAQNASHPQLVTALSDALASFYGYLRTKGKSSNVVVMTMSDFGRRLEMNSTYGTDHGTATFSFVMGDPVRGGVYGTYPDLNKPDDDGNAIVQVDFRNEIADVVTAMGGDPQALLGVTFPRIGML